MDLRAQGEYGGKKGRMFVGLSEPHRKNRCGGSGNEAAEIGRRKIHVARSFEDQFVERRAPIPRIFERSLQIRRGGRHGIGKRVRNRGGHSGELLTDVKQSRCGQSNQRSGERPLNGIQADCEQAGQLDYTAEGVDQAQRAFGDQRGRNAQPRYLSGRPQWSPGLLPAEFLAGRPRPDLSPHGRERRSRK